MLIQAWRLGRELNVAALERALGTLVSPGREDAPEPLSARDVPDLPAIRDLLAARSATGRDPAAPPQPRAELFQLATQDHHVLVVSASAGLWNGWSDGVFRRERELSALYALEARAAVWPPASPRHRARAARRHGTLADGSGPVRTADRPRPAGDRFTAAVISHRLDQAVLAKAEALAGRWGVPSYAVLLAGLEVLLARWSGLAEVTVLMSPDGAAPHERAAGAGDPVVLRRAYRPDEQFDALVAREAARLGTGLAGGDPPVGDGRPLPVRFSFRVAGEFVPLSLPGVGVTEITALLVDGEPQAFQCDLSLDVTSTDLVLRYAEELSDAATVRLFARHYSDLLAAAVADPSTAVGSILFAPPARVLRAPGPLAELLGALPDAPGGRATGARIVDDTDGARVPVGLRGRLQVEVRDPVGAPRWVDTATFGRCTPGGGILLGRPPVPEEPSSDAPARRRFGGDAAGMASQLAAVWAAKLGLGPAGPGEGRLDLGAGLTT
ncbi:hypothetical protein [Streptomyces sp. A5-4]|uniref:hypothetical protein n=1 Tax=Streptomyces sp. A5-4 TaxID=3384771 RepID=UPI003DA901EC